MYMRPAQVRSSPHLGFLVVFQPLLKRRNLADNKLRCSMKVQDVLEGDAKCKESTCTAAFRSASSSLFFSSSGKQKWALGSHNILCLKYHMLESLQIKSPAIRKPEANRAAFLCCSSWKWARTVQALVIFAEQNVSSLDLLEPEVLQMKTATLIMPC